MLRRTQPWSGNVVYTSDYVVSRPPNGNAHGLTEPSVSLWTPWDAGQTC